MYHVTLKHMTVHAVAPVLKKQNNNNNNTICFAWKQVTVHCGLAWHKVLLLASAARIGRDLSRCQNANRINYSVN